MILSKEMQLKITQRSRRRSAFTLMEVLVVVAILVVLASVAGIYVFRYLEDAKVSAARTSCQNLSKAVTSYYLKYSDIDSMSGGDLSFLVNPPDGAPFVDDPTTLNDPWGKPFQLNVIESQGGTPIFEVWTLDPQQKRISSVRAQNQ